MKLNVKNTLPEEYTHGGAISSKTNSYKFLLRRTVLSTFLWEDQFYEDGKSIADRIEEYASKVSKETLIDIAIEARKVHNLRHVSLYLLCALIKHHRGKEVSETIAEVISRPDEITELLALYWKNGKTPLSKQLQKGLAKAFLKFNEYSLAKYNRPEAIRLRDALFLSHAKPDTPERDVLWKKLINDTLETPDTWEVALSSGANKKETFERLIVENKLGYMALIRNLRNMLMAGCNKSLIKKAIIARKNGADKVLPFRFISAAVSAPDFENELSQALISNMKDNEKIYGKTVIIIDVSGSMFSRISQKSDMTRLSAATSLGIIAQEMFDDYVIYATAGSDYRLLHNTFKIRPRKGMAFVDEITKAYREGGSGGIFLTQAMKFINESETDAVRTLVITDEQDCGSGDKDKPSLANPIGKGYIINVGSYRNGIGYGKWTHIDGFSENTLKYIQELEKIN